MDSISFYEDSGLNWKKDQNMITEQFDFAKD